MSASQHSDHDSPMSPLLGPLPDHSEPKAIRHSDYGDREDVVAEAEELRHELGQLESLDRHFHYPPSRALDKATRKYGRRKRLGALSLGLRKYRSKARILFCVVIVWPIFWWAALYMLADHPALFPSALRSAKSTLFVVAHPDDECLFFAPTVLASVGRAGSHGALLVLSAGNHYGLGDVRKKELMASCKTLGIRDDRCDVINVPSLQDDPKAWWPAEQITKIVNEHIGRWMIDCLVTFDDYGVSGHVNHRAVSAAVTELALTLNATLPPSSSTLRPARAPALFTVESVFVLRKYAGLFDLPFSAASFISSILFGPPVQKTKPLSPAYDARTEESARRSEARRRRATATSERGLLISGWAGYRAARNAFWSHRSQLVWDRHLYMILSRFMYFNTIQRVI